jgi:hypothetical protein
MSQEKEHTDWYSVPVEQDTEPYSGASNTAQWIIEQVKSSLVQELVCKQSVTSPSVASYPVSQTNVQELPILSSAVQENEPCSGVDNSWHTAWTHFGAGLSHMASSVPSTSTFKQVKVSVSSAPESNFHKGPSHWKVHCDPTIMFTSLQDLDPWYGVSSV